MCGIAGIVGGATADRNAVVAAMLGDLTHRGPDDYGIWDSSDGSVTLGHRRLSILDLSPAGHQPMSSADGAITAVFNGEIYNFAEIRKALEGNGVNFTSNSDTEVLLEGYRRWRHGVLDRLVGMFAFAIWDGHRQEAFLARDRAGEKPLYYAQQSGGNGVAFASELSSLRRVPWVDTRTHAESVALFLELQYIPSPYSICRGIKKLDAAHAMVIGNGSARTWRYWHPAPSFTANPLDDTVRAMDELEALLRVAVRGQLTADVPVGAFLSGGIDSSLVVSVIREVSGARPKTFTIAFEDAAFDESPQAAEVARFLDADHTCYRFTEADALSVIPKLPLMYGEPFGDASALPSFLVSMTARAKVTVALSGDGGDEVFGGYSRYSRFRKFSTFSSALRIASELLPLPNILPRRVRRWVELSGTSASDSYRRMVSVNSPENVEALAGRPPSLACFDDAWRRSGGSALKRAMLTDFLTYLPGDILTKVDRASMAVSLEARAPLLDHRVVEFGFRLSDRLLNRKYLLKRLAYRRMPRRLLDRPKRGFGVPLGRWLRGDLRELLLDSVTASALTRVGIASFSPVQKLLDTHLAGESDCSRQLWLLLALVRWHQQFNDAN